MGKVSAGLRRHRVEHLGDSRLYRVGGDRREALGRHLHLNGVGVTRLRQLEVQQRGALRKGHVAEGAFDLICREHLEEVAVSVGVRGRDHLQRTIQPGRVLDAELPALTGAEQRGLERPILVELVVAHDLENAVGHLQEVHRGHVGDDGCAVPFVEHRLEVLSLAGVEVRRPVENERVGVLAPVCNADDRGAANDLEGIVAAA